MSHKVHQTTLLLRLKNNKFPRLKCPRWALQGKVAKYLNQGEILSLFFVLSVVLTNSVNFRIVATSPVKRATPVSMTSPNPDAPQISAASDSTKKPDEASSETASDDKICSITSPVTADSPRESSILPEPSASEVSNIETSSKNQELDINKPSLDKDNPLAETEQASNDISTSEETPTPLSAETVNQPRMLTTFDAKTITEKLESGGWDVLLSENSEDDDLVEELKPKVFNKF